MLAWVIYISKSRISSESAIEKIETLVQRAQARNMLLGITGSLIYTGSMFAQVLEGPLTALEKLVRVIQADPRHDVLFVTEPKKIVAVRRFKNWSLALGPFDLCFGQLGALSRRRRRCPGTEPVSARPVNERVCKPPGPGGMKTSVRRAWTDRSPRHAPAATVAGSVFTPCRTPAGPVAAIRHAHNLASEK